MGWGTLVFMGVVLFGLIGITACDSAISSEELPEDFIREFIAKHEIMVDKSLVYYYAREDQPAIAEQIDTVCRLRNSEGMMESLAGATFDYSGLKIKLVDQKEEYVNEEPVVFLKVAVNGSFKMLLPEKSRTIDADEVIILRLAHHEWKVTQSRNPWS
jgi:hypothetical protein